MQKIKNKKSKIKNQKGFTLIELLVVIAIIGLLTTVSVIAFTSVRQQARDAQRASDAATIRRALEMYLAEGVGYPQPAAGECLNKTSGVGKILVDANSIREMPFDPLWGNSTPPSTFYNSGDYAISPSKNFCYYYSGTVADYNLSYYLEEGNPNSGAQGIHVMNAGGER
jgi:prepilin-type N-terminal cleavage/methylation domain-containing protein